MNAIQQFLSESFKYTKTKFGKSMIEVMWESSKEANTLFNTGFIQNNVVLVMKKNWRALLGTVAKKTYKSFLSGWLVDEDEKPLKDWIRHLVPTNVTMFYDKGYDGFELYVGDKELKKILGEHQLMIRFDKNGELEDDEFTLVG